MAVVEQAVQHRGYGHAVPSEGLIHGAEAEVRGHDGRALLVAGSDDPEEQVCLIAPKRQVAVHVDDQQAVAGQGAEDLVHASVALRGLDLQEQSGGGDELGLDPGAGGTVTEGDGNMRLASPRRTEEDRVGHVAQPRADLRVGRRGVENQPRPPQPAL